MLNEYIASKQRKITKRYREQMASITSSKEIQGRLDSLSKQLEDLRKDESLFLDSSLSQRIFNRKEYLRVKALKENAKKQIPELVRQVSIEQSKLYIAKQQEMEFRAEKRAEEALLRDKHSVIHHLIKKDKSITNSIGFMLQCIEFDPTYITYDTSNSNIVYEAFIQDFYDRTISRERLDQMGYTPEQIEVIRSKTLALLNEIKTPQKDENAEYIVPQKYLYEGIRSAVKNESYQEIIYAYDNYMAVKNSYSKSFGVALDNLYKDKNNYVFLHNINYRGYKLSQEEINERVASICKNGLILSSMGNEVGKIEYTTLSNTPKENLGFVRLSRHANAGDVIAISIPKELFDSNGAFIGSNKSEKLDPSNPGTVLPEFVVGVFTNGEFIENPYDKSQRTQYTYKVGQKKEKEQGEDF